MKTAVYVWLLLVTVLWLAYAPWRPGAAARDVIQADASEYHAAAVSLYSNGVYVSLCGGTGEPDNYRPPLFPLTGLALYRGTGIKPVAVLALNGMLFGICVLMIPALARAMRAGDSTSEQCALALAAVCPVWIVTSLMYMPDALFTVLMAVFFLVWLRAMRAMNLAHVVASAVALGLATLAKPVSLYMPVALVLLFGWYAVRTRQIMRTACYAIVFCTVYAAILAPWCARNYRLYGRFSFVSYEGPSLLDYTAANVVRRVFGCDLHTARAVLHQRLQERYDVSTLEESGRMLLPAVEATNVTWAAAVVAEQYWPARAEREALRSIADLSAAEKKLFVAVFRSHLKMYALDSLRGTANIIFMPPWQECLRMTMPNVDAMELALACVRRDIAVLGKIGWWRVMVAVTLAGWMTAFAAGVACAAIAGLVLLVRRGEYTTAVTCIVIIGYFLAIAGPNGEARYRAPMVLLALPLAGIACAELVRAYRARISVDG